MSDILLPEFPILVTKADIALILYPDGEAVELSLKEARPIASSSPLIVCHKKAVAIALEAKNLNCFDVLELFAFCRPCNFCVPTVHGLAEYLSIPKPQTLEQEALTLIGSISILIESLKNLSPKDALKTFNIANTMTKDGWNWGKYIIDALGNNPNAKTRKYADTITGLKEWQDYYRQPPEKIEPITATQARKKLTNILEKVGQNAEDRPEQADYTSAVSFMFDDNKDDKPNIVIAEAGTGIGKTLGYIAPSSIFSEKNQTSVWISTYTKNLQRQIDAELSLIYPEKGRKEHSVTIRKGRENYICLLNFEEACNALHGTSDHAVFCGLIGRWLEATRHGDLASGDFPSWLADLLGRGRVLSMTDHRGECLYSACPHYRKCFIEKTLRRAKRSNLVVANHALVMAQSALGGLDDDNCPSYYVFDEGHHIFSAADSAFSAHLTGAETFDLARWIKGAESGSRSRAKGLKKRLEYIELDDKATLAMEEVINLADCLPKTGWQGRVVDNNPFGETEDLISIIYKLVKSRNLIDYNEYSIEANIEPASDELIVCAEALSKKLKKLSKNLNSLAKFLLDLATKKHEEDAENDEISKLEALCRSIRQRAIVPLDAFLAMLDVLKGEPTPKEFADWIEITRESGREADIGMHRHYIDPTKPFADIFGTKSKGMLITSATLKDKTDDNDKNWQVAKTLTGAKHILENVNFLKASFNSPFDYENQTKVFVINDVPKNDIKLLSDAYAELFIASGGGSLGIFTSIKRLKTAHDHILKKLAKNDLMLLSQHIDGMDTGTLIDIFRLEENSCLLGTDAVRDGVDVPGRSLRLIAFEKVPWPRADILHKLRKKEFGSGYNDIQTRMKLSQAFGRLIRRKTDKGVFIMLDSAFPSRLHDAFPKGVAIEITNIEDACNKIKEYLN